MKQSRTCLTQNPNTRVE